MILIEENFDGVIPLTEAMTQGKKTYLKGILAEASVRNRNQRIYKLNEMTQEVIRINESAMAGNFVLGELDHPSILDIKLENVSHKIVEMAMSGNQAIGKIEVLDKHPKGAILKSLIDSDVRVGFSTRGSGKVNESTGEVSGFRMITVDAVATPSCRSAYPETLEEQLQMYNRGEIITDLSEALTVDAAAQKYFTQEMTRFINQMQFTRRNK